jgi:hypothetical protein
MVDWVVWGGLGKGVEREFFLSRRPSAARFAIQMDIFGRMAGQKLFLLFVQKIFKKMCLQIRPWFDI